MKLNISLAVYNGNGISVGIFNKNDQDITLVEGHNITPGAACKKAAQYLRDAADRFDLLIKEQEPYKAVTQNKINKLTIR